MVTELTTRDLIIRKAEQGDLKAIWKNVWSDERIAAWMYWPATLSEEEAEDRLERSIRYQQDHDAFFVCCKETGEAIGMAGIREEGEGLYHESGICLAVPWQKQGYGRQILQALMKLVFEEKKGKAFIYSCLKDNEPSRHLAIGTGLRYLNEETVIWEKDGSERIIENYCLEAEEYHRRKE